MKLHYVFAGVGAGSQHEQQQGFIHGLAAVGLAHLAVENAVALPGLLTRGIKQRAGDRHRPPPRQTHNAHAALLGGNGRGDRHDGLALRYLALGYLALRYLALGGGGCPPRWGQARWRGGTGAIHSIHPKA